MITLAHGSLASGVRRNAEGNRETATDKALDRFSTRDNERRAR